MASSPGAASKLLKAFSISRKTWLVANSLRLVWSRSLLSKVSGMARFTRSAQSSSPINLSVGSVGSRQNTASSSPYIMPSATPPEKAPEK